MNATTGAVWLGHCRTGGRLYLRRDELHPGMNLIGNGAGSLAAVVARACDEAGMKTLVLDFGGRLSERLPNLETRSFGNFLYDSMRMEEKASLNAELAASAYTMALNLSFEQEGFLNSAIQSIALEQGVASRNRKTERLMRKQRKRILSSGV